MEMIQVKTRSPLIYALVSLTISFIVGRSLPDLINALYFSVVLGCVIEHFCRKYKLWPD